MWRHFSGTISGGRLSPTDVDGEFEETTGSPAPPHGVRFRWHGGQQLRPGEVYRLEIEPPRYYDLTITAVTPDGNVEGVAT